MGKYRVGERVTVDKQFHIAANGTVVEVFNSGVPGMETKYLVRIDGHEDISMYNESDLVKI